MNELNTFIAALIIFAPLFIISSIIVIVKWRREMKEVDWLLPHQKKLLYQVKEHLFPALFNQFSMGMFRFFYFFLVLALIAGYLCCCVAQFP